jgi:hypothetical protein
MRKVLSVPLQEGTLVRQRSRARRATAGAGPALGGSMYELSKSSAAALKSRHGAAEFRLILYVSFVVFLIGVVLSRVLPWRWRDSVPGSKRYKPIIDEAWGLTNRTIPFAFMG